MRLCDNCLRRDWIKKIDTKTGLQATNKQGWLLYKCVNCPHVQPEEVPVIPVIERNHGNVLYFDLEITKSVMGNYGLRVPSGYINHKNLIKERYICAYSASYMSDSKVYSGIVTQAEALSWWDFSRPETNADERLVRELHALMQTADVWAGHNVRRFDIKHAFARFAYYGLKPLEYKPKKTIDTLIIARKMAFESNTLDYLLDRFNLPPKKKIDDDDWRLALAGDKKMLKKIDTYCKGDVTGGKALTKILYEWGNEKKPYKF